MIIKKCDLCKKIIKGKSITINVDYISRTELCEKCASPILKFLEKNKFMEKEKKAGKK